MVERMWTGGPLREWAEKREKGMSNWLALASGGFGGPYVCDECRVPVDGVYRVLSAGNGLQWLCGTCREKR